MKITEITKRNIFDELTASDARVINWHGRLDEIKFLQRLYKLNELPTTDARVDNMEGDIYAHRYANNDWNDWWIIDDERLGLFSDDDKFIKAFPFFWDFQFGEIRGDFESFLVEVLPIFNLFEIFLIFHFLRFLDILLPELRHIPVAFSQRRAIQLVHHFFGRDLNEVGFERVFHKICFIILPKNLPIIFPLWPLIAKHLYRHSRLFPVFAKLWQILPYLQRRLARFESL